MAPAILMTHFTRDVSERAVHSRIGANQDDCASLYNPDIASNTAQDATSITIGTASV